MKLINKLVFANYKNIIIYFLFSVFMLFSFSCSNTLDTYPPGGSYFGTASDIVCGTETKSESMPTIKLPYPNGETYTLSQGYNGSFSHDSVPHDLALDFLIPEDDDIVAVADGKVMSLKKDSSTGCSSQSCANDANYVLVDHGNNIYARYVHMCKNCVDVELGDTVSAGDVIARSGNTGWSTVAHLHFEMISFASGCSISYPFTDVSGDGIPIQGNEYTSTNNGSHGGAYTPSKISGRMFAKNGIILESETNWYITDGDSVTFSGTVNTGESTVVVFLSNVGAITATEWKTTEVNDDGTFSFTYTPDQDPGEYRIALDATSDGSFSTPGSAVFLIE